LDRQLRRQLDSFVIFFSYSRIGFINHDFLLQLIPSNRRSNPVSIVRIAAYCHDSKIWECGGTLNQSLAGDSVWHFRQEI
jgi:hypothetical protein